MTSKLERIEPEHDDRRLVTKSGSSTLQMVPTEKPEGIFETHFPNTTEPVEIECTWSFCSRSSLLFFFLLSCSVFRFCFCMFFPDFLFVSRGFAAETTP